MATKSNPTLFDLANYFQTQANRTRNAERKAHYQKCANEHRAKATEVNRAQQSKGDFGSFTDQTRA
jgi:hypothetical protein